MNHRSSSQSYSPRKTQKQQPCIEIITTEKLIEFQKASSMGSGGLNNLDLKNIPTVTKDQPFYYIQRKTLLVFDKKDPKSGIKNYNVAQDYSFDKKNPIYEDLQNRYKIHWAFEKKTGLQKIAKIFMKHHLDSQFTNRMKREIILMQNTRSDPFLLNCETIFESTSHLYLIYEGANLLLCPGYSELQSQGVAKISQDFDTTIIMMKGKRWIKQISTFILSALLKINQYGMSATSLRECILLETKSGNIKLFNLNRLTKHNDTITKKAWQADQTWTDMSQGNVFDLTDSWTLGIMIIQMMMPLCYPSDNIIVDRHRLPMLLQQAPFGAELKDLLTGLLSESTGQRLTLQQALIHPYFYEVLNKGQLLKSNFEYSFNSALSKIRKIRKVVERKEEIGENFQTSALQSKNNRSNSLLKSKQTMKRGRNSLLQLNMSSRKSLRPGLSQKSSRSGFRHSPVSQSPRIGSKFFGRPESQTFNSNSNTPRNNGYQSRFKPQRITGKGGARSLMESMISHDSEQDQQTHPKTIVNKSNNVFKNKKLESRQDHRLTFGNMKRHMNHSSHKDENRDQRRINLGSGSNRRNANGSQVSDGQKVKKNRGFFGFLAGMVCHNMRVC